MNNQHFTTAILVDQTPAEAFAAINNVRGWWSGDIKGQTDKLNEEFTYRYQEFHYSRHKLIELIPGQKVVWLITDSSLNFVKDKNEWTGTKIIFEISRKNDKTEVRFTHLGLDPGLECFDACSNAWGGYITRNLRNLITTGKEQANTGNS